MDERRGVYRALVEKPEGRRSRGRTRRRWEDNIKMDIREVGWEAGSLCRGSKGAKRDANHPLNVAPRLKKE
jgi:hypothetical protein